MACAYEVEGGGGGGGGGGGEGAFGADAPSPLYGAPPPPPPPPPHTHTYKHTHTIRSRRLIKCLYLGQLHLCEVTARITSFKIYRWFRTQTKHKRKLSGTENRKSKLQRQLHSSAQSVASIKYRVFCTIEFERANFSASPGQSWSAQYPNKINHYIPLFYSHLMILHVP